MEDQKELAKEASETPKEQQPKRRSLGRGLATFFPEYDFVAVHGEEAGLGEVAAETFLPMAQIKPSLLQPRMHFDEDQLRALAESIRQKGILQPILVRPAGEDAYEIVAGERRYRAAQLAELDKMPVIVRDLTDRETLEIALIENLHRQDLTPIEEAQGYKKLVEKFDYSHEALAQVISQSRSHIGNVLRLLDLPAEVQTMIQDGRISFSHAKLLFTLDHPEKVAEKIVTKGLNVRETERLITKLKDDQQRHAQQEIDHHDQESIREIESRLKSILHIKTKIVHRGTAGKLTFYYKNLEDLDKILHVISMMGSRDQ